ncbi:bifunctional nuclease family protein [Candidatus Dependentiae bacterium]|nr:bifunctional nuclease family protein [Candidatus Dependentiae bacterium]
MENYQLINRIDIAQDDDGNSVIILKSENDKVLIISIGETEAHSIFLALNEKKYERPLTHDLLKTVLQAFKCKVEKVFITKLEKNVYYAIMRLSTEDGKQIFHIDCRPSDAVAVGIRFNALVFVNDTLLNDMQI